MRYELTDFEWVAIRTMLPNKPRGDDRRVLNGAPWRDLPGSFGPYTTCYNRFVRWRRADIWDRIMDSLTDDHDAAVQMMNPFRRRRGERLAGCMGSAASEPL
jgi:transposase